MITFILIFDQGVRELEVATWACARRYVMLMKQKGWVYVRAETVDGLAVNLFPKRV